MLVRALPMRWGSGNNYAYIVADLRAKVATIVDPAEPDEVLGPLKKTLSEHKLSLVSIINTHHHADHSAGNGKIRAEFPKAREVWAGKDSPLVTRTPHDQEQLALGTLIVKAIHTPCHTQDSICWFVEDPESGDRVVFTGDTLFTVGCGRFFEGTAKQMLTSLTKLVASVPSDTKVYPGHEYTRTDIKFAKTVLANDALTGLDQYANNHEYTTGAFTIGQQLLFNPFLRTDDVALQAKLGLSDAEQVMAKLRELKNKM